MGKERYLTGYLAYKVKNYNMAATFGRRLLELNPKQEVCGKDFFYFPMKENIFKFNLFFRSPPKLEKWSNFVKVIKWTNCE